MALSGLPFAPPLWRKLGRYGRVRIERITLGHSIALDRLADDERAYNAYFWDNLIDVKAPPGLRWLTIAFNQRQVLSAIAEQAEYCAPPVSKREGQTDLISKLQHDEAFFAFFAFNAGLSAEQIMAHTPRELSNLALHLNHERQQEAAFRVNLAGGKAKRVPVPPLQTKLPEPEQRQSVEMFPHITLLSEEIH